jgi:hypothetical protein
MHPETPEHLETERSPERKQQAGGRQSRPGRTRAGAAWAGGGLRLGPRGQLLRSTRTGPPDWPGPCGPEVTSTAGSRLAGGDPLPLFPRPAPWRTKTRVLRRGRGLRTAYARGAGPALAAPRVGCPAAAAHFRPRSAVGPRRAGGLAADAVRVAVRIAEGSGPQEERADGAREAA